MGSKHIYAFANIEAIKFWGISLTEQDITEVMLSQVSIER